jgi:hypothetical protein
VDSRPLVEERGISRGVRAVVPFRDAAGPPSRFEGRRVFRGGSWERVEVRARWASVSVRRSTIAGWLGGEHGERCRMQRQPLRRGPVPQRLGALVSGESLRQRDQEYGPTDVPPRLQLHRALVDHAFPAPRVVPLSWERGVQDGDWVDVVQHRWPRGRRPLLPTLQSMHRGVSWARGPASLASRRHALLRARPRSLTRSAG